MHIRYVNFTISNFDDPQKIFDNHKHRMFIATKDGYIFKSNYNDQKLSISFNRFKIDETVIELFNKIGDEAIEVAKKYSEEEIGDTINRTIADAAINCIRKYDYLDDYSIFDICTDVFISILNGHCLSNGNKRSAFSFLKLLLGTFGFYLKYSDVEWIGTSGHKTLIESFAENLEKEKDIFSCTTRDEIKDWIIKNVIISYEGEVKNAK